MSLDSGFRKRGGTRVVGQQVVRPVSNPAALHRARSIFLLMTQIGVSQLEICYRLGDKLLQHHMTYLPPAVTRHHVALPALSPMRTTESDSTFAQVEKLLEAEPPNLRAALVR